MARLLICGPDFDVDVLVGAEAEDGVPFNSNESFEFVGHDLLVATTHRIKRRARFEIIWSNLFSLR